MFTGPFVVCLQDPGVFGDVVHALALKGGVIHVQRFGCLAHALVVLVGPVDILAFNLFQHLSQIHFLLRLDTARSDEALSCRAAELGVRLGFLSEYAARPDPDFAHTLVINYGGLQSEDLERTIGLLSQILE